MGVWIKARECDCPNCAPNVCDAACECTFSETQTIPASTTGTFANVYAAGNNFLVSHNVSVIVTNSGYNATVVIAADAANIYSYGPSTTSTGVDAATVPANTANITVTTIATTSTDGGMTIEVYC